MKNELNERKTQILKEKRMLNENMFYKEIVESLPDAIFIEDLDGNIMDLNESAAKMLGYERSNLIGKNVGLILPEEVRKKISSFRKYLEKRGYMAVESYNLRRDGSLIPVEISASMVRIGDKNVVVVVSRNLEKRKFMESKYRIIGNLARDAIIIMDRNGKITYWNYAAEEIFGYKKEEIMGKKMQDYIVPEEMKEGVERNFDRIFPTDFRGIRKYPIRVVKGRRKGGEIFYLEISPVTFSLKGEIYGMVFARDVTARKKKEEMLHMLYRFGNRISSTLEMDRIFMIAYEEIKKIVNLDAFTIALIDEKEKKIRFEFIVNANSGKIYEEHETELDDRSTLTGWIATHRKKLYVGNVKRGKLPARLRLIGEPMLSFLGVPMLHGNEIVGVLTVQSKRENAFKDEEIHLVETLASQLAVVVANAKLYRDLKLSEGRYRALVQASNIGITVVNLDNRIIFVNDKLAEMLGYEKEDMINRSILEFASEKGKKKMQEGIKRRRMGISDSYESSLVRKDGKVIDVEIYASPLRDESGKMIGTIGVIVDITERKRLEERIDNEREKYKKLFNNVGTVIAIIQDGIIVFVNKEFDKMTGYTWGEVVGEEFTRFVAPDMREIILTNYRKRMLNLQVPDTYMVKILRKDGKILWAQVRATVIDWDGKKADMVSLTDITPIKEMQDKLIAMSNLFGEIKLAPNEDEIYDSVMDFLYYVGKFINSAILRISGDKLRIVKQRGYDNVNFDIPVEGKGITAWVVRNNTSYYAPDVRKEKIYIPVDAKIRCEYATPISVGDKIYGVIDVQRGEVDGISDDDRIFVDLVAMYLALALRDIESRREIEKARDIQELMLHIVSHDLKNPLAVISGYAELLETNYDEEYIKRIEIAVEEAKSIIEKARTLSKISTGKIEEKKENINLGEIIKNAVSMMREKYGNVKIDIPKGDTFMIGYPIIKEVFVNLIDNAFKYGADEVKISIEENEKIVIRVADNGIGIPEENKEIVFESFKKIKSNGSGLGLSIVKKIVEIHGGRIWVEDNRPGGSVFVIELPKG